MKKCYPFLSENWRCFGFAAVLAVSVSMNLNAQSVPAIHWDKAFGGSGNETFKTIQPTSDGGYILGGISTSGISGDKTQVGRGGTDFWIVKLDAAGTKLWDKTFGGNGAETIGSVQQTSDGGYILGGSSDSGISGDKTQAAKGFVDYWIIKTDANGNKLWDKSFGGSVEDYFRDVRQTTDGGFLVAGHSRSGLSSDKSQAGNGLYDFWIIKLDASGNKVWDKTYGGAGTDGLFSFQQTADGGFIMGGPSNSGIGGDKSQASKGLDDYWILKTDALGNKLWDATFGGNNLDNLQSLQQTADGGYILGGFSASGISGDKTQASNGGTDMWIVKLDANGTKLWDRSLGGLDSDDLTFIRQIAGGGYVLAGSSTSGISGDKSEASRGARDGWVARLGVSGNKLWDKTLGGSIFDVVSAVQETADGSLIIGGYSESGISGDRTAASNGGTDFWIIKLGGNQLGSSETESGASYISIFPNPNQGKFNLQLSNLTSPKAEITVSDLVGKVVLKQEFQTLNNQLSEEINLPNAKGIYLLQIKTGSQVLTRKIVVE